MRGVAAFAAVLVAAVGCGAGESSPGNRAATPETNLKITVWPKGDESQPAQRWTLRCDPDGGTLPRGAAACDRLAGLKRPFAPVPSTLACIDLYGGPQRALVTGVHRGNRVWASVSASNGCEIARWNKLKFLFGGLTASGQSPS